MTWDAKHYEQWFETGPGRFALEIEKRLLHALIAAWPRRGRRLLEIGCGTGIFLEALWEMGFEVSGLEQSQEMLGAARARLGNRADIHLGAGDHTSFDDRAFDYAVLWNVLEFCRDPAAVLREAARVASRGVLIGFLNRWSVYYLTHGRPSGPTPRTAAGTLRRARWFTWPEMRSLVLAATGCKPGPTRSVLPGPMATWRPTLPWRYLNGIIYPACVGAFTAMRVDFERERPLTPLMAWKTEPGPGC
ncbi:MAG: class I SAM-dependent methyltransferase [Desulfovibrionaceae bacterium]|nr:class I SAM-dependent methyltransferase [Desulfovibrionaceae bacterium]